MRSTAILVMARMNTSVSWKLKNYGSFPHLHLGVEVIIISVLFSAHSILIVLKWMHYFWRLTNTK